MSSRKNGHSWLPHIYVILIGVSLGGALMFSLIFIGAYYYVSLRNTFPSTVPPPHENKTKFFHHEDVSSSTRSATPPFPPQAHSSPKGGDGRYSEKTKKQERADECGNENGLMSATSKFFSKYRSKSAERMSSRSPADPQQLHNINKERHNKKSSSSRDKSNSRRSKRELDNSSEIEIDINSLR